MNSFVFLNILIIFIKLLSTGETKFGKIVISIHKKINKSNKNNLGTIKYSSSTYYT